MKIHPRTQRASAGAAALLAFAVPSVTAVIGTAPSASASAPAAVEQDGPHAPKNRVPAPTTVTRQGAVAISHYDLGDVEIGARPGQYRAPVRGSLVTPVGGVNPSKLIIVSHLRSAGCADEVFAFPCPGGKEMRLDRGMEYLGEALAKQGYTVLIPDVAPVWIGSTLTQPYDQTAAWLSVVGRTRTALADDVAGRSQHFGLPLRGRIDLSGVGLIVHSRSGFIAGPAANAWRSTSMPLTSVLAYGPAYDVPDVDNRITAPVPADLPYLGLVGDKDQDVPYDADLWLAQNIEQKRTAPALVATVPGLGHDSINRTLSSAHIDDRLDCTPATCPSAAVHERFLVSSAQTFFDATMRHAARASAALPLDAGDALPATVGGLPARWLAVTNAPDRVTVFDADTSRAPRVSAGSTAAVCRFYDSQDPRPYRDRCPDPGRGTPMLVSKVARVELAAGGVLSVPTHVSDVRQVDVQVADYDDRADGRTDSPLEVVLTTSDGRRVVLPMPAAAAAVTKNRATADTNGTYVLGTLRVPVPADLRSATITSVEIRAPRGGVYALRAIDVRGRVVTGPATSASPTSPVSTRPGPGSSVSTGPVVQTDGGRSSSTAGAAIGAVILALLALLAGARLRVRPRRL